MYYDNQYSLINDRSLIFPPLLHINIMETIHYNRVNIGYELGVLSSWESGSPTKGKVACIPRITKMHAFRVTSLFISPLLLYFAFYGGSQVC